MDPFERLAIGIVESAASDYRKALKYIKGHPDGPKILENEKIVSDCERFFCGDWMEELTLVDGKMIMQKIKNEIFFD